MITGTSGGRFFFAPDTRNARRDRGLRRERGKLKKFFFKIFRFNKFVYLCLPKKTVDPCGSSLIIWCSVFYQ